MESLCPYYWVKPQKEAAHVAGKEKELTVLMKESTAKLHETSDNLINVKLLLALTDRSHFGQVSSATLSRQTSSKERFAPHRR